MTSLVWDVARGTESADTRGETKCPSELPQGLGWEARRSF